MTSPAINEGIKLIKEFEDLGLKAYPDPGTGGAPWTIGWGNTRYLDGFPVRAGQTITAAQADTLLLDTLTRQVIPALERVPFWKEMSPKQQGALMSFAWNLGWGFYGQEGFRTISTRLKDRAWPLVPEALLLYRNPGTNVEAGLRRRREAEGKLWREGLVQSPPASAPTVAERTQWITQIKALNISQPDALTCQAACIGMGVGSRDVQKIRRELVGRGQAGNPSVMAAVIRNYGRPYTLDMNASLAKVYEWLKQGEFLITHGWFTGSGHVICLDGLKRSSDRYLLDVKDPWSEFDAPSWSYNKSSTFYDGLYSDLCIYAACVAGVSVSSAKQVYQRGLVDVNRGGMWVHRFLVK